MKTGRIVSSVQKASREGLELIASDTKENILYQTYELSEGFYFVK